METRQNNKSGPGTIRAVNEFVGQRFNAGVWWGLAVAAYAGSRATQLWLDASYARSQFPVPFYEGQTTFDAAELKGYYQHMIERGTLDVYLHTQRIDYVFMATAAVSLFLLSAAALRTIPKALRGGWLGRLGRALLWIFPAAAPFDAAENGVSFVMLADPTGFADWLVYPYSSFAVVKFTLFAGCYLWAIGSIAFAMGSAVATGFRWAARRMRVVGG